jgi:RNA polymerase sigma factor (sigma-70 family)
VTTPAPDPNDAPSRLDAIVTQHTLLAPAHQDAGTQAEVARAALVLRYRRAIRGYLGAVVKSDADADELTQEVMVKMLQGRFAGFQSERGRFRDYLKTAVRNAALQFLRRAGRASGDMEAVPDVAGPDPTDDAWLADWRRTLLEAARQALHAFQSSHPGNVYATVLDLVRDHPDDDSAALAERLTACTGQTTSATTCRKQLNRARRKFAELLLEEVKRTLDDPAPERVRDELIEVGLLPYLRDFLPPDWLAGGA